MMMVVTLCSSLLLGLLIQVTSSSDILNILIGKEASRDEHALALWMDGIIREFQDKMNDSVLEYTVHWVNQSDVYLLATEYSGLNSNWSAVLDLTKDCFLYDELPIPIYISVYFCDAEIPSITPSSLFLLQAAVNILKSHNISLDHLALILDDTEEIIQDGTAAILNGSALTMVPLYNGTLIDLVLRRLVKESASLATVVIGTGDQNKYVLQMACSLESLLASVYWVIITTDWTELGCPPCELDSIIYLRYPLTSVNMYLYDDLPKDVKSVVDARETFHLWDGLKTVYDRWDLPSIGPSPTTETNTAYGQILFEGYEVVHKVELDVYKLSCEGNSSNTTVIGNWHDGRMDWYVDSGITDPKVYRLRVATFHEPPFVIKSVSPNGNITYSGYAIDVLREIMALLDDDYVIYEVDDKTYGSLMPDGRWNGLVGELVHGTADIAIGPISVTAERESVVDFTTPYYDFAGIQIVMKKVVTNPNMFAFSDVFASDVWLCWAAVLCTTAILIFVFERYSPFSTRNAVGESTPGTVYSFKECWWFVITSFTMSGSESTPRPISTRVLVAGFWFFCSIMMSTYTANLAAHLTLSRLTDPVESLDDLAAQSEIKYSALEGSTVQTYFFRMAEIEKNFYSLWKDMSYGEIQSVKLKDKNYAVWDYPLGDKYQNIWKSMESYGFLNSSSQGMDKVLSENFAFFHDSPMIKYEMSVRCDLEVIGGQFSTKPYAFALRENSAHTKKISSKILELQQERKLDDLKENWWNTSRKNCETKDENDGLTFETVAGIFIVMAGGTVFSVLVLLAELTFKRVSERKKKEAVEDMKDQNNFPGQLSKSEGSTSTLSSRL